MTLLRFWQVLFLLLLAVSLITAVRMLPHIQIDTDLADISPANQHRPEVRAAIDALQESISQRIILLISGTDEDTVYAAEEALRSSLAGINTIEVQPASEVLAESVLNGLKPYRFSLLTQSQQQILAQQPASAIADQAQKSLYGLSGQVRAIPFAEDPLGWHSETLLSLLQQTSEEQSSDRFSLPVVMTIRQGAMNIRTQRELSTQLDAVIHQTTDEFEVAIDRSGVFFFAADAARSSKQDVSFISTGSTIGVVLLLLLVFRNVRALILPVISIGLGIGFALVVTHWWFGKVHILTIVFGASLIGIVIDYSLHYFYHGANRQPSANNERSALFRALTLSLATSMIGYAALSFSGLQALQKVAVFSCCGLFMAWLSVICLGDLALKKPMATDQRWFPALVSGFRALLTRISVPLWSGSAILLLAAAAYTALVIQPFSDDPRVFFKPPAELLASEQRVAAVATDYEPGRYIIINGQNRTQLYVRHRQLMEVVAGTAELNPDDFTSVLSWVPDRQQQEQNYQSLSKLYGSQGAVELLYSTLGNPAAADSIMREYQSAQNQILDLTAVTELLGDALPPVFFEQPGNVVSFVLIRKGIQADALAPVLQTMDGVEYVNTLKRTESALAEQRRSASSLLMLAYVLVAVLMCLRFRQIRAILLVTVPLCATAALLVVSQLAGFPLNLFHIMALFLVLGFGMDYTIFTHELRAHADVTLQAILLSALTSLLSFGLLSLSSIPVVASFGTTLLVGNMFNLMGAFVYARLQSQS